VEPHGAAWTVKELFVYPNEYIYWTIQIVMYPYMTGLVAGAFVLSSLYHVFGIKQLKAIARMSLVFSLSLLPAALLPLVLHLQQPLRGLEVMLTPHFTSAIAAFGIVFFAYAAIVLSEIWFVYRELFVRRLLALRALPRRTTAQSLRYAAYQVVTLGAEDISQEALRRDHGAIRFLATIGIPVACFLHGYAGFIFGSVKANALWMTPLMPVIFICSAVVSGVALCLLTYSAVMEIRKRRASRSKASGALVASIASEQGRVVATTTRYLVLFLGLAITLELLDLVFRSYTAVKSWDILRSVIYGKDFVNIFVIQYGIGNLVPLLLLTVGAPTVRKATAAALLVLLGVFMMRWNVVIGGQSFSSSFAGFMHYILPVIPSDLDTFKDGLLGALLVAATPFATFWLLTRFLPVLKEGEIEPEPSAPLLSPEAEGVVSPL
jgi:Ni/Fe-hydrogenase subunit HybB-like protein